MAKTRFSNQRYEIFIDTCSLLSPGGVGFLNSMQGSGRNLKIIKAVWEELDAKKNDPSLSGQVCAVLDQLGSMQRAGLVEYVDDTMYRGTKSKGHFADVVFLTMFSAERQKRYMYLVTQDKKLQRDILRLNTQESVRAHDVGVGRLKKTKWGMGLEDIFEWRKCKECGADFFIAFGEKEYFESHGLKLPHRCYDCRKKRRDEDDDGSFWDWALGIAATIGAAALGLFLFKKKF